MPSNGKQLEELVAFVEKTLSPHGLTVGMNERVFNENGIQIAEFDVEVSGMFGSTPIKWLIECRDRPSQGAAPAAWIEQLVGRRARFGFNKVTAVSTAGFAAGAVEFAKSKGIELREVATLSTDAFKTWFNLEFITEVHRSSEFLGAQVLISEFETKETKLALEKLLLNASSDAKILRSIKTGLCSPFVDAFFYAIQAKDDLFDDVVADGTSKAITMHVTYSADDDHFVIDTPLGAVRVQEIVYSGKLKVKLTKIPLIGTSEYRHFESKDTISQIAAFAPQQILGNNVALEFHKIAETGETHIMLRKV